MQETLYLFLPHFALKFSWHLDSQPIMDVSLHHRFAIGQYVDISGDVISHLNISHVRPDDGGLYRCVASNSMGSVEHSARLNVYGKFENRPEIKVLCLQRVHCLQDLHLCEL